MRMADGCVPAYSRASRTMSSAGMPVTVEAQSGGYCCTRSESSSKPTVC